MVFEVRDTGPQNSGVVVEQSQPSVALAAQKAAYMPVFVAVIYGKPLNDALDH